MYSALGLNTCSQHSTLDNVYCAAVFFATIKHLHNMPPTSFFSIATAVGAHGYRSNKNHSKLMEKININVVKLYRQSVYRKWKMPVETHNINT